MAEMHKKKILFLITKSNWGGAQRYVFDIASQLDPAHFDVAVALGGNGQLAHALETQNIRIIPLKNLERDISFLKEFKSSIELFKLIRSERPDILHINSSKAGGLGALIGRLCHVPRIIFTAHGWAFNENRPLWQRIIITFLHWFTVLLTHITIVVSEATKRQMPLPFIQRKMHVIHNGRSIPNFLQREKVRAYFMTLIPSLASHKHDFWSVTIGELHPVKQHDVVIRAIEKARATFPTLRHIIIGEGEDRERLQLLIRELNLSDTVFLPGSVPEASHYLHGFDLFILGSRSEALGYVIIEAAAAGLPILASNVGGIPEIITSGKNGVLVHPGDSSALERELVSLMNDPHARMDLGRAALLRAQDFTFEKSLSETLDIYTCA